MNRHCYGCHHLYNTILVTCPHCGGHLDEYGRFIEKPSELTNWHTPSLFHGTLPTSYSMFSTEDNRCEDDKRKDRQFTTGRWNVGTYG